MSENTRFVLINSTNVHKYQSGIGVYSWKKKLQKGIVKQNMKWNTQKKKTEEVKRGVVKEVESG